MQNRETVTEPFWSKWPASAKGTKFDLSDLEKWPLERFNQIYLLICDVCHPKEAACQKRKKVTEAFLSLTPPPQFWQTDSQTDFFTSWPNFDVFLTYFFLTYFSRYDVYCMLWLQFILRWEDNPSTQWNLTSVHTQMRGHPLYCKTCLTFILRSYDTLYSVNPDERTSSIQKKNLTSVQTQMRGHPLNSKTWILFILIWEDTLYTVKPDVCSQYLKRNHSHLRMMSFTPC